MARKSDKTRDKPRERELKNVTVTMSEEVARWVRVRAAEENISMAQFLGEILKERMRREATYQTAMMRYLSRPPRPLRDKGAPYPERESLH